MSTGSPTDSELMARTRRGDDGAFEELYRRYEHRVYSYLWRLVRDEATAADLRQDAFFRLWRASASWSEGSVPAYLIGVARNLAVDGYRRQQAYDRWRDRTSREPQRAAPAADAASEHEELEARVHAAIDDLPDRPREVFMLKRDAGLTYAEIAELLGIAPKTVEAHMSKALRVLRETLVDVRSDSDPEGG